MIGDKTPRILNW